MYKLGWSLSTKVLNKLILDKSHVQGELIVYCYMIYIERYFNILALTSTSTDNNIHQNILVWVVDFFQAIFISSYYTYSGDLRLQHLTFMLY